MELDVHALKSHHAMEIFITARPAGTADPAQQARQIFSAIRNILQSNRAWICHERVFAPRASVPTLGDIRSREYGGFADAVEPTYLAAEEAPEVIYGVQVYAIAGPQRPEIVSADGGLARIFDCGSLRWVAACGLKAPEAGERSAQALAAFRKAQKLLTAAGGDLRSLARTWVFIDKIHSWYDQFNLVRNAFFKEQGLLGPGSAGLIPASTGIGVSPADGSGCAVDLLAVIGPNGSVRRHETAGRQRSARAYGSAFARVALARTPAGETVFVSGTAAINSEGETCFRNDISGQIQMTIENVKAVLQQFSVESEDVVQAIAYCASRDVREEFRNHAARQRRWPWLAPIADVCREDLLFEVEVAALRGAKKML